MPLLFSKYATTFVRLIVSRGPEQHDDTCDQQHDKGDGRPSSADRFIARPPGPGGGASPGAGSMTGLGVGSGVESNPCGASAGGPGGGPPGGGAGSGSRYG